MPWFRKKKGQDRAGTQLRASGTENVFVRCEECGDLELIIVVRGSDGADSSNICE